jgi:hypothetical protein
MEMSLNRYHYEIEVKRAEEPRIHSALSMISRLVGGSQKHYYRGKLPSDSSDSFRKFMNGIVNYFLAYNEFIEQIALDPTRNKHEHAWQYLDDCAGSLMDRDLSVVEDILASLTELLRLESKKVKETTRLDERIIRDKRRRRLGAMRFKDKEKTSLDEWFIALALFLQACPTFFWQFGCDGSLHPELREIINVTIENYSPLSSASIEEVKEKLLKSILKEKADAAGGKIVENL